MKNAYVCSLSEGRYITNFLQTALFETQEHFRDTIMTGRINEWLKYGFSINDNPCRREFLDRMLAQEATCPDLSGCVCGEDFTCGGKTFPMELYLPHGNVNVDQSGFWHIPTSLTRWYVTWLNCARAYENLPVELSTPGGATVWLNGEKQVSFRPFTRNMVKHTEFSMSLRQGMNLLCVCLEDLAERDTDFYFRLAVPAGTEMTACVPMPEQVDTKRLGEVIGILDNAFVLLDQTHDGMIRLDVENDSATPLTLRCGVEAAEIASIQEAKGPHQAETVTLHPGERRITVRQDDMLPPGFSAVCLSTEVDGIPLTRRVAAELTQQRYIMPEGGSIEERARRLLCFAAANSAPNTHRAVALLATGGSGEAAESMLRRDLPGIRSHKDCCDFYLIGQLYVLMNYADRLSETYLSALKEAILTFRFWIDEPGNDVMWFFSENHALLFHACQYLSGQLFPDEVFTVSGLTGREAVQKARRMLEGWFDDFEREFMTEWNSNAYLPIDTMAFGYMYLMMRGDDPLRERVRKALDRIFLCLAMYGHKRTFASSYGRSYEKQLKGNLTNGPASLLYWAYGEGMITSETGAYVPLCLSDYRAPEAYRRYLTLEEGEVLFTGANQGYEEHVNLTLYKTKRVMLSAANAFKPYLPGYQEHILQATIDAHAQVFVNHPGETHAFGSGRPSYWAGNGMLPLAMQWEDLAVVRFKIPGASLVNYTHLYFPEDAFDRTLLGDDWCCGERDGAYIFAFAKNGLVKQTRGAYQREEMISPGLENVWLIRVGDVNGYASMEDFIADSRCVLEEESETAVTIRLGSGRRVTLSDMPAAITVDGETHLSDLRGERAFMTINHQ